MALEVYDFRHQCVLSFCIPETLGCCPHFGSQLSYRSSESPQTVLMPISITVQLHITAGVCDKCAKCQ